MSRAASRFSVGTWVDVTPFSEFENAVGEGGVEERTMGFGTLEDRILRDTKERLAQVFKSWCLALSRVVWMRRDSGNTAPAGPAAFPSSHPAPPSGPCLSSDIPILTALPTSSPLPGQDPGPSSEHNRIKMPALILAERAGNKQTDVLMLRRNEDYEEKQSRGRW